MLCKKCELERKVKDLKTNIAWAKANVVLFTIASFLAILNFAPNLAVGLFCCAGIMDHSLTHDKDKLEALE